MSWCGMFYNHVPFGNGPLKMINYLQNIRFYVAFQSHVDLPTGKNNAAFIDYTLASKKMLTSNINHPSSTKWKTNSGHHRQLLNSHNFQFVEVYGQKWTWLVSIAVNNMQKRKIIPRWRLRDPKIMSNYIDLYHHGWSFVSPIFFIHV